MNASLYDIRERERERVDSLLSDLVAYLGSPEAIKDASNQNL